MAGRFLAFLLVSTPVLVQAADARLDAIHAILLPMRTADFGGNKVRGATPQLTTVKHQLREWIESRVSAFQQDHNLWSPALTVLQEQLNDELSRGDLICARQSNCALGFLDRIVLDMQSSTLVIRTAVGIDCGYDESAYVYEQDETTHVWHKFWQSEQDDYEEGKYFPQLLRQVLISATDFQPGGDRTEHLILTLGREPWCSSNWHSVYYRVWRTKGANEPALLLSGSEEWAYVNAPIQGSITETDVWFEYEVESVEGGFTRREIDHYVLRKGKLERVDPIALSPQDFTAFWLRHPWPESSLWTAVASRSQLEDWRKRHPGPFAEFGSPSLHCALEPDLWQVDTDTGEDQSEHVYFLMRWRPPYHFTMLSASDRPRPDCKEKDAEADELHSLFLPQ